MCKEDLRVNQQFFDTLLDKASATALVLLHENIVLVSAGKISASGLEIICHAVADHWQGISTQLINRYAGLLFDAQYHLVFVKLLAKYNLCIGLFFPLGTPLIRVRQDMTDILRVILEDPSILSKISIDLEQSLQAEKQLQKDSSMHRPGQPVSPLWQEISADLAGEEKDEPLIELTASTEINIMDNNELDVKLRESFGAANKNLTHDTNRQTDINSEALPWQTFDLMDQDNDLETPPKLENNYEKSVVRSSDLPEHWHPLPEVKAPIDDLVSIFHDGKAFDDREQQPAQVFTSKTNQDVTAGINPIDEATKPIVFAGEECSKRVVSDFTFYLVPQDNRDFIVGHLAQHIRRLVPEICLTYGWTLGHLSVRPDYLKWMLIDFPEVLLQDMLQVVRQLTADSINHYHLAASKNKGFWSPGHLVDPYNQDLSTQSLLMRFGKIQH